ncbi:hypothetical protein D3C85_524750 [compost metagenome]
MSHSPGTPAPCSSTAPARGALSRALSSWASFRVWMRNSSSMPPVKSSPSDSPLMASTAMLATVSSTEAHIPM